ncbi:MAG: hypothetical protein HZB31_10015 [Nitrospirae bacterium]|nr:hypothetical protein [Nitrospirota bacterium]
MGIRSNLSGKDTVRIFEQFGYKKLAPGLLRGLIRKSDVSLDDFLKAKQYFPRSSSMTFPYYLLNPQLMRSPISLRTEGAWTIMIGMERDSRSNNAIYIFLTGALHGSSE